ncbi:MAG: PP2C family protein-serine/threonine phosphatase [Candidatus Paceibacterota bacterium]
MKIENLVTSVFSAQGKRPKMEDAFFLSLNFGGGLYAGVYDGHGGDYAAYFAKRYLHTAFLKHSQSKDALRSFDEAYNETSRFIKRIDNSGTTAADVFIYNNIVYCANAGDTRIIAISGTNTKELSLEHRLKNETERHRVSSYEGVETSNQHLFYKDYQIMVTRALGDIYFENAGVISDPHCNCDDTILADYSKWKWLFIATDGVFDVMDDNEIAELFLRIKDPHNAAEFICKKALKKSTDNVTAIAIKLQ